MAQFKPYREVARSSRIFSPYTNEKPRYFKKNHRFARRLTILLANAAMLRNFVQISRLCLRRLSAKRGSGGCLLNPKCHQ